jgi:hypothetical protein
VVDCIGEKIPNFAMGELIDKTLPNIGWFNGRDRLHGLDPTTGDGGLSKISE